MAILGIFSPVPFQHRLLVDGGIVDPVPYEVRFDRCDVVVAIDVTGTPDVPEDGSLPALPNALRGAVRIMQRTILAEKTRRRKPDIHIRMNLDGIGILQFGRVGRRARCSTVARGLAAGFQDVSCRGK